MELQLNRRRGRGVTRFLVRWRGHTPADDEWLRHCRHKVAEYDAAGPRRRAGLRDAPTPPAAAPPPPPSAAAQPPLAAAQATPPLAAPPLVLFNNFIIAVNNGQWTNMSHVLDGVVHLVVRADNPNGYAMTNTYQLNAGRSVTNKNVQFYPPVWPGGAVGFYFYSNTVPAVVELQVGILEDRPLARAESFPPLPTYPYQSTAQVNYLQQQSGHVHVFRQQVTIPNLDPTAYQ